MKFFLVLALAVAAASAMDSSMSSSEYDMAAMMEMKKEKAENLIGERD